MGDALAAGSAMKESGWKLALKGFSGAGESGRARLLRKKCFETGIKDFCRPSNIDNELKGSG